MFSMISSWNIQPGLERVDTVADAFWRHSFVNAFSLPVSCNPCPRDAVSTQSIPRASGSRLPVNGLPNI